MLNYMPAHLTGAHALDIYVNVLKWNEGICSVQHPVPDETRRSAILTAFSSRKRIGEYILDACLIAREDMTTQSRQLLSIAWASVTGLVWGKRRGC